MELGTYFTHIFKIIFSTFFFQGSINRLSCSQNIAFVQISHFSCNYRVKYLKCIKKKKYILEHKCEWNLSVVWLCLATFAFYLNCLNRVVLAHPFWALATFPVCSSFLSCLTNRAPSMGTKWSGWILKNTVHKKQYMCRMMIILCQWDFNEQIEKLVRVLLCTSKKCSRKCHAWVQFVSSP
jgi:hypothetical protein